MSQKRAFIRWIRAQVIGWATCRRCGGRARGVAWIGLRTTGGRFAPGDGATPLGPFCTWCSPMVRAPGDEVDTDGVPAAVRTAPAGPEV